LIHACLAFDANRRPERMSDVHDHLEEMAGSLNGSAEEEALTEE